MDKKNHGFIPSVINQVEHYTFGDCRLEAQVLQPNGQWDNFLPSDEEQNKNGLETYNCTNYGTLHIIGTLGKFLFGASFQKDLSERYTGIISGTTQQGNDPHLVAEVIRTISGCIPDVFLPFDATIKTWAQYYNPKPITYALFKVGYSWMKKYKFGHDWVIYTSPADRIAKMKDALRYSPLGVSGFAWSQHSDGLYYSDANYQNHWFEVYGYNDGKSWKVFDSYDNTHKLLDWNYNFGQIKRYAISKNPGADEESTQDISAIIPYIKYRLSNLLSWIKS